MIHTASLVHDDVLDECSVRRGEDPSLHASVASSMKISHFHSLRFKFTSLVHFTQYASGYREFAQGGRSPLAASSWKSYVTPREQQQISSPNKGTARGRTAWVCALATIMSACAVP